MSGILFHALDNDTLVDGGIHHAHFVLPHRGDLLNHRLGKRLKRARNNKVLLLIHCVLNQHIILQVVDLLSSLKRQRLDVIEHVQNLTVGALRPVILQKTQCAEKGGDEKLATSLLTVKIHIQ